MRIAVLGAGHIGSAVGRLWYAAGHEVIFAGRDAAEPGALAGRRGDARSAAGDLHRRFRFLGDAGVWRLLTSAARDLG